MKNRILLFSDPHGEWDKLNSVFVQAQLTNMDTLICLGDIVDRGPDSFKIIEFLIDFPNVINIRGNHDFEFFMSITRKQIDKNNWENGQKQTYESYSKHLNCNIEDVWDKIPSSHYNFFAKQKNYYLDLNNRLFVHGGINRHVHLDDQVPSCFYRDRDMYMSSLSFDRMNNPADVKYSFRFLQNFKEIYIGHTPTQLFGKTTPIKTGVITCLDTGAGKYKDGLVTLMDLDKKTIWQS
jgi:serine/threonine protein phosphatase 1